MKGQLTGADDGNEHTVQRNRSSVDHLSAMSLIDDIESSDLQFHSIHMTNRSALTVHRDYYAVLQVTLSLTTYLAVNLCAIPKIFKGWL